MQDYFESTIPNHFLFVPKNFIFNKKWKHFFLIIDGTMTILGSIKFEKKSLFEKQTGVFNLFKKIKKLLPGFQIRSKN